jgi:hypothetical protein
LVVEQRRFMRAPLGAELRLSYEGRAVNARGRDISLGGMFVETDLETPLAAVVTIQIALPGGQDEFEIDARVRWHTREGIGLQFLSLGPRATHQITDIVKAHQEGSPPHASAH